MENGKNEEKTQRQKLPYKFNRLETTKLIGPWVDDHWDGLRVAKKEGKKVAWSMGPLFPIAYAMDIPCHFHAGYAAYCGGRKGVPSLLEAAEAEGHILDACSYHRLHMGVISAIENQLPIREEVMLPKPDIVLSARLCTEHTHQSDAIYRHLKVPNIAIDILPAHNESDFKMLEKYTKRQLNEVAIPFLENFCGKKFNYDRLSQLLAVLKEAALLRNECWKFFEQVPSPWTLWDWGISIAPVFYLMGQPKSVDYFRQLKAELQQRTEKGIGGIHPEERFRVYWDGWVPWSFLGPISRKLLTFGANPIVGKYPWEFFPHPEEMDPSNPIDTIVKQWYTYMMSVKSSPEFALPFIEDCVEKYHLDGLIMYASRTCRLWNLGEQDIIDEIERKYGIPGVILEADMIDDKFFSEAQIDTRLQAFFEMMEARKRPRSRR